MIDPDLSTRPYADHWRAARVYYDGVVNRVGAHGVTFLREARRAAARELAALEDFLRRLVLMMALALSLPPPKPRAVSPAPSRLPDQNRTRRKMPLASPGEGAWERGGRNGRSSQVRPSCPKPAV